MSFLISAALAIALLVAGPLVAHLLRRGRAPELAFPPARLVPAARSVARSMARLEDRLLFALRALMIAALALLGAVPLVRCSRLSLERSGGASVAFALVIDDSLSMRAVLPSGRTRFERAKAGALELLASARRGDAVAVVLAGRPARVALSPTTDLKVAEQTISALSVRDLSTDLAGAVELSRSLVADLPQKDQKLAVLSDFAGELELQGKPPVWAPVPELAEPVANCGIAGAEPATSGISVHVVCSGKEVAEGRALQALAFDPLSSPNAPGEPIASAPLLGRGGSQRLLLQVPAASRVLGVRLTGKDGLPRDDASSVGRESASLEVAVSADATRSRASTGGPTIVEQALSALGGDVALRPLLGLPESAELLNRYSALILDDPSGIGPEARGALLTWVQRGGVAIALLGPSVSNTALGATLEPFVAGAVRWETKAPAGLTPASLAWLGPEAEGFSELGPRGRVRLESASSADARVLARWTDDVPFLIERPVGRGVLLLVGLPSSPDESDFALRPGFLGLLDHFLRLAREHSGQRRSTPGDAFRFPIEVKVEVLAADGVALTREVEGDAEHRQQLFRPELAGRYRVRNEDGDSERVVAFDSAEIQALPRPPAPAAARGGQAKARSEVDASPEATLVVAGLLGLEACVRLLRRIRGRARAAT